MQAFAHHVGDILALIAGMPLPRDFDEPACYGFDGEAASAAKS